MYTKEQITNISTNLEILRKLYNEKQYEVADAIGISESTYSGYINMTSIPSRENLKKLAQHYHIIEDDLINTKISKEEIPKEPIYKNIAEFIQKVELFFPIIEINNDDKDYLFKEASNLHKNFLKSTATDKDIIKILNLYFDSYDKFNNLDSYANIAMIILLLKNSIIKKELSDNIEFYNVYNEQQLELLFKDIILKRFDDDIESSNQEINVEKLDDKINKIKKILISDSRYKDFLYYYILLEYFLGIGNLELSPEINTIVATEMLTNLVSLNNKYAINLNDKINELFNFE